MPKCSRSDCEADAIQPGTLYTNAVQTQWAEAKGVRRDLCVNHFFYDVHGDTRCRIEGCTCEHFVATLRKEPGCRERALMAQSAISFTHADVHAQHLPCRLPFCNDRLADILAPEATRDICERGRMTIYHNGQMPMLLCHYHSFVNPLLFPKLCIRPGCVLAKQSPDVHVCGKRHCGILAPRLFSNFDNTPLSRQLEPLTGYDSAHRALCNIIGAPRPAALVLYYVAYEADDFYQTISFASTRSKRVATCRFQGCDMAPALDACDNPTMADTKEVCELTKRGLRITHDEFHERYGLNAPCHHPFCVRRGAALDMLLITKQDAIAAGRTLRLAARQLVPTSERSSALMPEHTCLFHLWCHPLDHPTKCLVADCMCRRSDAQVFCDTHLRAAQMAAAHLFIVRAENEWLNKHQHWQPPRVLAEAIQRQMQAELKDPHVNPVLALMRHSSKSLLAAGDGVKKLVQRLSRDTEVHTVQMMDDSDNHNEMIWAEEKDNMYYREQSLEIETRRAKGELVRPDSAPVIFKKTSLSKFIPAGLDAHVWRGKLAIQYCAFQCLAPYLLPDALSQNFAQLEASRGAVLAAHSMAEFKNNRYLAFLSAGMLFFDWLQNNFAKLPFTSSDSNYMVCDSEPVCLLPLIMDTTDIQRAKHLFEIYVRVVTKRQFSTATRTVMSCFPHLRKVLHRSATAKDDSSISAVPDGAAVNMVWESLHVTEEEEKEADAFHCSYPGHGSILELLSAMLFYACYTRGRVAPFVFFANMLHHHLSSSRLHGLWNTSKTEFVKAKNPGTGKMEYVLDANGNKQRRPRSRRQFSEEVRSYLRLKVSIVRGSEDSRRVFGDDFKRLTSLDMTRGVWNWIVATYTGEKMNMLAKLANIYCHSSAIPSKLAANVPWLRIIPAKDNCSSTQLLECVRRALLRNASCRTEPCLALLMRDGALGIDYQVDERPMHAWIMDIILAYYSPQGKSTEAVIRDFVTNGADGAKFNKKLCSSIDYLETVETLNGMLEAKCELSDAVVSRMQAVLKASISGSEAVKLPVQLLWECYGTVIGHNNMSGKNTPRLVAVSLFWTGLKTPTLTNAFLQKSHRLSGASWKLLTSRKFVSTLINGGDWSMRTDAPDGNCDAELSLHTAGDFEGEDGDGSDEASV
jgi:hypothetical protein